MINPNKVYSASQTGTITNIHYNPLGKFSTFYVNYKKVGDYMGYSDNISNFKRFKIGDKVKCKMQFSITLDKFIVCQMRKDNKNSKKKG